MSTTSKIVLLLKKGNERKWDYFESEMCADTDESIYKNQGWEIVGRHEIEVEDDYPCYAISDYKEEKAQRFGEIFPDIESGKYGVVGTLGEFEITRKDLRNLQTWITGALEFCGEDPK